MMHHIGESTYASQRPVAEVRNSRPRGCPLDDTSALSDPPPAAGRARKMEKKARVAFPETLHVQVLGPIEKNPKESYLPYAPKVATLFGFDLPIDAFVFNQLEVPTARK